MCRLVECLPGSEAFPGAGQIVPTAGDRSQNVVFKGGGETQGLCAREKGATVPDAVDAFERPGLDAPARRERRTDVVL